MQMTGGIEKIMPPWKGRLWRAGGWLALGLLAAGCDQAESLELRQRGSQPVAFNHQIHVASLSMDCQDCHRYVMTERKASLPDPEVCAGCHSEMQGESSEERKLVELLQSGAPLTWRRVYMLPKHVYFSHFRHVTLGQIGCPECHGAMDQMTRPPTRPAGDILDMDYCMDCHRARQASEDCLACHL